MADYSRRRSLLGLVRPDRDRQARRSYAAAVYELYRHEAAAAEQRRKPQPTKTVYAPGSMEWLAEQKKSG